MATERNYPNTHITNLKGKFRVESSAPTNPKTGDMYVDTTTNHLSYYNGTKWLGAPLS